MPASQFSPALLEAGDSVLIAVDIQIAFLDKLPVREGELLLTRASWLIHIAHWRQIPILATAERIGAQPLASQIAGALPAEAPIFDKTIFGLADQPDILSAVERTGRQTAVVMGLETDVCVSHSALGLLQRGYRVAVVADATGSPAPGHELGLERMRAAGALLVSTKSLFYEWMRNLEWMNRFYTECPDLLEVDGILL